MGRQVHQRRHAVAGREPGADDVRRGRQLGDLEHIELIERERLQRSQRAGGGKVRDREQSDDEQRQMRLPLHGVMDACQPPTWSRDALGARTFRT